MFPNDVIDGKMKGNNFYAHAGIDMYYYFSPQLRLQSIWSLNFYDQNEDIDYRNALYNSDFRFESLSNYFSVTLTYSLF